MCKISTSYDEAFFLALFMICMQQYSACRFMLLWHVQWERFTHMEQVDYSDLLDWCWSCVCKCQIVNGHSEWWFVVQNSSKLMSVCCFCCMNDLVLVQTCTVQILWKMNLDQYLWHSPKCCSIKSCIKLNKCYVFNVTMKLLYQCTCCFFLCLLICSSV